MASDRFTDQHWRKSSQWASLLRPHAQLAAEDTDVSPRFASHCFTYLPNITFALPPPVQVCACGLCCVSGFTSSGLDGVAAALTVEDQTTVLGAGQTAAEPGAGRWVNRDGSV